MLAGALLLSSCGGGLTAAQQSLVDDSTNEGDASENVSSGLEDTLSGGTLADPYAIDPTEADPLARVRTNPGLFFKPAGCITTTITGMTATHVFSGCTGPWGLTTFDGTVTSTWSIGNGALTVHHQATNFKIDGATVNHDATVTYTRSGTTFSRTRMGTTSGTTAAGKAFQRSFDHSVTWDPSSRCITRDGTVDASFDGRAYTATISNYERCGVGSLGCPKSGTISLERSTPAPAVSLTIDFLGGTNVEVKLPGGKTVDRTLVCVAGA
jgi:hypothetical protein